MGFAWSLFLLPTPGSITWARFRHPTLPSGSTRSCSSNVSPRASCCVWFYEDDYQDSPYGIEWCCSPEAFLAGSMPAMDYTPALTTLAVGRSSVGSRWPGWDVFWCSLLFWASVQGYLGRISYGLYVYHGLAAYITGKLLIGHLTSF